MTEKIALPKKLTLSIDPELNRLLDFQAALNGKGSDRSHLLDDLVMNHIEHPDDWDSLVASVKDSQPTGVKASGSQGSKTTYYLSVEAEVRLRVHKMKTREDLSTTVANLIRDHIPHWGIFDTVKERLYDPTEKALYDLSTQKPISLSDKDRLKRALKVISPAAEAA
jgi:hypothetical protein